MKEPLKSLQVFLVIYVNSWIGSPFFQYTERNKPVYRMKKISVLNDSFQYTDFPIIGFFYFMFTFCLVPSSSTTK